VQVFNYLVILNKGNVFNDRAAAKNFRFMSKTKGLSFIAAQANTGNNINIYSWRSPGTWKKITITNAITTSGFKNLRITTWNSTGSNMLETYVVAYINNASVN